MRCAGFAAVDALFGGRKVVIRDTYSGQQTQSQVPLQQHTQYSPPPFSTAPSAYSPGTSSYPSSSSSASASEQCYTALKALGECESRNGLGSDVCRFFRSRADECQAQQAALLASAYTAEQR